MQRVFLKKKGEGMPPPIFKAPHTTAEDKETSISPDTSAELEPGMSFLVVLSIGMIWSHSHPNAGDVSGLGQGPIPMTEAGDDLSPIPMLTSSTVVDDGSKND